MPLAGHEGTGPRLPAAGLDALAALRQRIAPPEVPEDVDKLLDRPLEAEDETLAVASVVPDSMPCDAEIASSGSGVTNVWSEAGATDEIMQELEDAAVDCTDEQLASIARRLKRARHRP
eukprot:2261599-Karenia_brevis.AAC.1